ncbi:MAG: hypothetical protein V1809_07965 [Planctomycetota bacterium]
MRKGKTLRSNASRRHRDRRRAGDDVDMTLVRWTLSLTPAERLQVLQNHVNAIQELRRAFVSR